MEDMKVSRQKRAGLSFISGKRPASVRKNPSSEQLVTFSLYAPQAHSVAVAGSFNNWTPGAFSLKKDFSGTWTGAIRLKPGTYQYRFFVDKQWADDPNAKKTAGNEFGTKNAVLEVR